MNAIGDAVARHAQSIFPAEPLVGADPVAGPSFFKDLASVITFKGIPIVDQISAVFDTVKVYTKTSESVLQLLQILVGICIVWATWSISRNVWSFVVWVVTSLSRGRVWLDKQLILSFRFGRVELMDSKQLRQYAARPGLEKRLKQHMGIGESEVGPNGQYLVLYGPRGSGKSTCVNYVANKERGIVVVRVNDTTTELTIMQSIAHSTLGDLTMPEFMKAMRMCSESLRIDKFYPVVVFEVERARSEDVDSRVLSTVAGISKDLAVFCKVLVIVSDANAALHFNTDNKRKRFLLVGELSPTEASQMWKKLEPTASLIDEQLINVFDRVGTMPSMLVDLHRQLLEGEVRCTHVYVLCRWRC